MHKLNLRRMENISKLYVLPIVLILQAIHDEYEFLERSISI